MRIKTALTSIEEICEITLFNLYNYNNCTETNHFVQNYSQLETLCKGSILILFHKVKLRIR